MKNIIINLNKQPKIRYDGWTIESHTVEKQSNDISR